MSIHSATKLFNGRTKGASMFFFKKLKYLCSNVSHSSNPKLNSREASEVKKGSRIYSIPEETDSA